MSKKELQSLAGQAEAACIIIQDIRQQLISMNNMRWGTEKVLCEATDTSEKLRRLLRMISYEAIND